MALKNLAQWMARRPGRSRAERGRARTAPLASLGQLLGALDDDLHGAEGPVPQRVWLDLVGPRIADRSQPARIEPNGNLLVRVPDAIWAQELSLLSSTIISRLGSMGVRVTGLRFIVDRVAPPRRGPTRFERRKVAPPVALPSELRAEMDSIEDPELRAAMVRAAQCSLAETEAAARRRKPDLRKAGKRR